MDEQSSRKSMKNKGKGLGKTTKRMQQISSDKKVKKKKATFVKAPTLSFISSSSDSDDVEDVNVHVKRKALNKKSSSKSFIAPTPSTSTPSLKRHLEEDETRGRKAKKSMLSPSIGSELCNSDERQKVWEMLTMGAAQSPESDEQPELPLYNPYVTDDVTTYIPIQYWLPFFATNFLNNRIPSVHNILINKVPYTTEMKSIYIMLKKEAENRQINKEENTVLFILHLWNQVSTRKRQLSQSKWYQKNLSRTVRSYNEFVGKQILCSECEDVRVNTLCKAKMGGKEMYVSMYCKNCLEKINERNEKKGKAKIRFYPITFRGSNFNFQKGKKIKDMRSVVPPSPAPHRSWKSELDSEDKDEDFMMPSTSRSVASPKKKVVQKGKSSTPALSYKSISFSSPPSSDVEETAQNSKESSDSEVFYSDDDSSAAEESDAE